MKRGFGKVFLLGLIWVLSSTISAEAATLESFTWVGKGSDRVGDWGRGTPDGRPDGHFQLRLNIPGQREVQSIAVYSSDASGNLAGGQVWHSRETRYWMLGIFRGGRQVNRSHVSTLGLQSGRLLFDLFGNDSGWFKEGQHFLAEVTFGDGGKVRRVVRIGYAAPPTSQSFTWVGKGSDRVGDWGRGTPDGRPDGHFQLRLNIPGQREVQSIAVYSSDASGNPAGGQVWHSRETRWWMLGVFLGGRQVNRSHVSTLGSYSGQVLFDLFGNDSGWFKEGQHFLAEVTFGDGNKVRSVVRLGAVGVVPPRPGAINLTGRWRCNDGGTYYLRQVGSELWWYGASGDGGRTWTNVFYGRVEGNQASGRWADVPQGRIMNVGEMRIEILSPNHFRAIRRTGGFGGSDWTR